MSNDQKVVVHFASALPPNKRLRVTAFTNAGCRVILDGSVTVHGLGKDIVAKRTKRSKRVTK